PELAAVLCQPPARAEHEALLVRGVRLAAGEAALRLLESPEAPEDLGEPVARGAQPVGIADRLRLVAGRREDSQSLREPPERERRGAQDARGLDPGEGDLRLLG